MKNETINTNAQASAFGWDFQCSLALYFVSMDFKKLARIKVEGPTEDIELFYDNGHAIFIQSKAQLNPYSSSNTNAHLKNALKTLINASQKTDYSQLYYGSNINNPFVLKEFSNLFNGGPTNYSFFELLPKIQDKITKYVNENAKKNKMLLNKFDYNRIRICTLPFYGDDDATRYRFIRDKVDIFLTDLDIRRPVINRVFDYYQLLFYKNPSKSVSLSKEELAWPIIIFSLDVDNERFYEDYEINLEEEDAIENKYQSFIESKTVDFALITNINTNYSKFITSKNYSTRKKIVEEFIDNYYEYFSEVIFPEKSDDITHAVTKLILWKILKKNRTITTLRNEVGI
ncbi:hypothetical protein [Brochothrix thermosphacta]|uniref:hypothetical protein n=1 Tax=Brochothrix thermosphacta TaxID=2756 RepID=UPI001968CCBB|nr:hypothetical protein [Brochothrix thermosphacta]